MNMLRNYGAKLGFLTLFCDALKAAIPALIGNFLLFPGDPSMSCIALYVGGLSAVLGHMFPIFYGFKGGKGIACTVGVFTVANPLLSLIIFVADFIFFYFIKIGSLASMIYIILFAIINNFLTTVDNMFVAMIIMWVIVILDVLAHKSNFIRLFANEERLTSFKEGVQKDLDRIQERKLEKLGELEEKEASLAEIYEEKLVKNENKINQQLEKDTIRVSKQKERLQHKYAKIIEEKKTHSNEIIEGMQARIEEKKQKETKKASKAASRTARTKSSKSKSSNSLTLRKKNNNTSKSKSNTKSTKNYNKKILNNTTNITE